MWILSASRAGVHRLFPESEELQKLAEPVDGPCPDNEKMCEVKGMHIIAGYAESATYSGKMYNRIFIDDNGSVIET